MPELQAVLLSELTEGEITPIRLEGLSLALYLVGGRVYCTLDSCPHADCLFSEAGVIDGDEVECSCHGSRFRLRSGINTAPPAAERLQTYRVRVDGDAVLVNLPD